MFTKKMVTIFLWEFTQRVKSKSFLFSVVFMPTVIIGFTLLPAYFATHEQDKPLSLAVADKINLTGALHQKIIENNIPVTLLPLEMTNTDSVMKTGLQLARQGIVDGFMVLDETVFTGKSVSCFTKGSENNPLLLRVGSMLNELLTERELEKMNLSTMNVKDLINGFHLKTLPLDPNESDETEKYITGIIVVMMLFFSVLNSSGSFLRGLSEEKNNRVMEILISSALPRELMTGKILGLGCVGLLQMAIWFSAGAMFGGKAAFNILSPALLMYFAVYFVLGFLLFASIFAVIGSVLSSEQDIQPIQGILSMVGILPVAFAVLVLQNPDSLLVNVLSYVPVLTPTLMILRIVISDTPGVHIIGTMAVLTVSLLFALRTASRIFEVAILMHGKKLTFSEVLKWTQRT